MRKAAVVRLTDEQRADLTRRLEHDALTRRQRRRLEILVLADQGQTDAQIVQATGASDSTVERIRKRFTREGFEAALVRKKRATPPTPST